MPSDTSAEVPGLNEGMINSGKRYLGLSKCRQVTYTRYWPYLCGTQLSLQADGSSERRPAITLPGSPFLTIAEVAHWLGVSVSTVKRLIAKGELVAVRIGGRRKIPNSSLMSYVTSDVMFPEIALSNDTAEYPINNTARLYAG